MSKTVCRPIGRVPLLAFVMSLMLVLGRDATAAPRVPTLSGLRCADGEVARFDVGAGEWVCSAALSKVIDDLAGVGQQLTVFDADGVAIGPAFGGSAALLEVAGGPLDGTLYTLAVNRARLVGTQIFYTGTNCTGDAYVTAPQTTEVQGALQGAAVGPDPANGGALSAFLLVDPDSVGVPINAMSRFGLDPGTLSFGCTNSALATDGRMVIPVLDLEPFVPPFVLHF